MTEAHQRVEQFMRELSRVGGKVLRADAPEDVGVFVRDLARRRGATAAAREASPLFEKLAIDAFLEEAGVSVSRMPERPVSPNEQKELIGQWAAADLGLTQVHYALADTGTLALRSGAGHARSLSLLPPVHVAFLLPDQILSGMDELFAVWETSLAFREASCLTLITGPSRTADIELTLTIGVHGPRELYVILLEFGA